MNGCGEHGPFPHGDGLYVRDPCSSPSDGARDERIIKGFGSLDGRSRRKFN